MRLEKFQFSNAEELKNWLNQFNKIDLSQATKENRVFKWCGGCEGGADKA